MFKRMSHGLFWVTGIQMLRLTLVFIISVTKILTINMNNARIITFYKNVI